MKKIFALMLVVCFASLGCDDKKAATTKTTGSGSGTKTDMKKPEDKKTEDKKPEDKHEDKKDAPKPEDKKDAPKPEDKGPKVEKK